MERCTKEKIKYERKIPFVFSILFTEDLPVCDRKFYLKFLE